MNSIDIRRLVIDRRALFGIGLGGRTDAIARWLHKEHNVIATESWIDRVLSESRENSE